MSWKRASMWFGLVAAVLWLGIANFAHLEGSAPGQVLVVLAAVGALVGGTVWSAPAPHRPHE